VTIRKSMQVMSCCSPLVPVHQLSFNSRSTRMSFSQVQRVFIVKHYLASHSYLTCQNEFRGTFPDSPVPNKSTISCSVNCFHHCINSSLIASNMRKRVHHWMQWTFPTLNITLFFCFLSSILFIFWQIEYVSGMGCMTFWSLCTSYYLKLIWMSLEICRSPFPTSFMFLRY
jgi:hypothetical protein